MGLVATLGGLAAILLVLALRSISSVLVYVGLALFIAMGLEPALQWLKARGVPRSGGVVIIFAAMVLLVALGARLLLPPLVDQLADLVTQFPENIRGVVTQPWFTQLNESLGGALDPDRVTGWVEDRILNPQLWMDATGGLLAIGAGVVNASAATIVVLVLSIYFLATLPGIKRGLYSLVSRPHRDRVIEISEQVVDNVGIYVSGMVFLAFLNATLGYLAMTVIGVPFASILAVIVFFVALVPLVGSVVATIIVTLVALIDSAQTALAIGIYYLVYLQVEAYVLTPRVMSRSIAVPGSLVVIGTIAGGTLLGIVGALVAIPVTAAILLVIKQVVIPRQNREA